MTHLVHDRVCARSPAMLADLAAVRAAHIILASSSPRRVDILNNVLEVRASVVPSTFEENLDKSQFTPAGYVAENARQKALEVYSRLSAGGSAPPPSLVVGADTVVVRDSSILEKPRSAESAQAMLASLSGRAHEVSTGVALIYAPEDGSEEPFIHSFVETTQVEFASLPSSVIDAYIASGEPMDKAGSYGIQGRGGTFVKGIVGCYHNVVGFPMHRFCMELDCERLQRWVARHAPS
jgi:septum formation protein